MRTKDLSCPLFSQPSRDESSLLSDMDIHSAGKCLNWGIWSMLK